MTVLPSEPEILHLKKKPWNGPDCVVPAEIFSVTTMLTHEERRMLYYLARNYYSGQGAILDMGSYLGGSTICFAAGLRQRDLRERVIHAYDLFKLSEFELERDFRDRAPADLRTRSIFNENLKDYLPLIEVHEGDVLGFPWDGGAIELLFIDIAKSYKVFDHIVSNYFSSLIPLRSLVILQDYIWKGNGPWHHVVIEKLSDYFEYLFDTEINSAVFRLRERIPERALQESLWLAIPFEEKISLMDRAIDKLDTESKKDHLRGSREILLEGKDLQWGMQYHSL